MLSTLSGAATAARWRPDQRAVAPGRGGKHGRHAPPARTGDLGRPGRLDEPEHGRAGLYLATGECARRDLIQFILGAGGIYLLGGLLIVIGPGEALLALVPHPGATTRYILELVAGAVVLLVGTFLWRIRGRLAQRDLTGPRRSGRSAFVLGLSIMVLELPTAFPYFAAIALLGATGLLGRGDGGTARFSKHFRHFITHG